MSKSRLTNPFRSPPRRRRSKLQLIEKINPSKLGMPPGTPIHVGPTPEFDPFITAIRYSEDQVEEWLHIDPVGLQTICNDTERVLWIDIEGVHDVNLVTKVSQTLDLHPLTSEDVVNCHLRPQFESYPGYFFFALKMIYLGPAENNDQRPLVSEHVSLILKGQTLAAFQEKPGDIFGRIRDRIRTKTGKIRIRGSDHLLYALLDSIVDGYLQVVDQLAERIELLEDDLRKGPRNYHLTQIYNLKREILWLRKTIFPVRDMLNKVQVEQSVFQENTRIYLRDLSDHVSQVTDSLSLSMEMIAVLVDTWHSMTNQKMNIVMKTLTMISTVFLPLNFIAGIYGMNFEHMPELKQKYGYYGTLAAMFFVAIGILSFFVAKGWLWDRSEAEPSPPSKT